LTPESESPESALGEGRQRIQNFKCKGYDKCSTEHKLILTHFGENFIFWIKLAYIETIFHILNRSQPQGTEVCPPGSRDIHPFNYLKCGVSRRGINRSSHKRTVLDHHHGGLQQHPQGGHQERVLMVLAGAGGGHWYQGQFYAIKVELIPN
jgi:hypothetical protein